jgi:anaerobic ribonucleoside-triphosphate reductase activating protein
MLHDSAVDGPGVRFSLFTQGCPHRCPGCHNPETHSFSGGSEVDEDEVWAEIERNPLLQGVTLTGGEPFAQDAALAPLAKRARERGLSVWAFTGYTFDELLASPLLPHCDVLVDGRYERGRNSPELPWRGSSNQRVINVQEELLSRAAGGVVGIDGRCCAGKTSLAARLSRRLGAPVIHLDDFFPPGKKPDGDGVNIDTERFLEEAAPYLRSGEAFSYRRYICRAGEYSDPVAVPAAPLRIVEGSYALSPRLRGLYSVSVFMDIGAAAQRERLLTREGARGMRAYAERWLPLEESYFERFDVRGCADYLINGAAAERPAE